MIVWDGSSTAAIRSHPPAISYSANFETIVSLVYAVILWQILKLLLAQDQPQKKIKVKIELKENCESKTEKKLPRLNYEILKTENTTENKTENHLERNHPTKKLKASKTKTRKNKPKRNLTTMKAENTTERNRK
jgi:hypothetical protein